MSKIVDALEKVSKLRDVKNIKGDDEIKTPGNVMPSKFNNHHLVTINEPNSPVSEEYRRLKTMLIRDTKQEFLNTIMITSAVDSEGKTLTSINLAVTMAQELDHSVLLIDADLRKPRIHNYLGIDYKYGLTDYLREDMDISDALIKTGIENLVLLPAGKPVSNPVELLSSEKMKSLLKEVKNRYSDRYVIIDTPPLLPFADALVLGVFIDAVLFVIKEGGAQKKLIDNAMVLIQDLKVLGVVFNAVRQENLDGHYSHYYGRNNRYAYQRRGES
jgi:protein-tyrosine kinase